jgi:hypothetical protein
MNVRTPLSRAVAEGKGDAWTKMHGGFAVYRLSSGEVDYFPVGQPANVAGVPDRGAELLARYRWNCVRWSRTY